MCYEETPTVPPLDEIVLTSADGSTFGAYAARPANPSGARIVLLPDVGGLRPAVADLARRFTETGAAVIAVDYFGRTAGTGPRSDDFDNDPHVEVMQRANVLADARAALDYLGGDGPAYALGFCLGGATALVAATEDFGLAGAIAFCPYHGEMGQDPALPDDFVSGVRVPVLGLFGGDDKPVPPTVAAAFEKALEDAGKDYEIVVYPGQPHGFFEKDHFGEAGHEEAAADAFERVKAFLRRTA
ncbi:MAG: dienelactone hydrolase family protein [Hamadaea sp.]|uniref:dienelactone hydrolase family protein n=1 Tax=Hamadaea sp. TaxID=2024425 RepID=UPI00181514FC|nr:dienelactone hydrolase family protein [Hamadaea sp.]NUR70417.1 dienelactone hydrolase family protein [Hamadaea sp.]NUT20007.1 dienelactone hydrolase family protein [Hamadaea sp.]